MLCVSLYKWTLSLSNISMQTAASLKYQTSLSIPSSHMKTPLCFKKVNNWLMIFPYFNGHYFSSLRISFIKNLSPFPQALLLSKVLRSYLRVTVLLLKICGEWWACTVCVLNYSERSTLERLVKVSSVLYIYPSHVHWILHESQWRDSLFYGGKKMQHHEQHLSGYWDNSRKM